MATNLFTITASSSGIFTVNDDNSVTLSGSSQGSNRMLTLGELTLPVGKYNLSGSLSNNIFMRCTYLATIIDVPVEGYELTLDNETTISYKLFVRSLAKPEGTVYPRIEDASEEEKYISKVVYGDEVLIDLTEDTVTEDSLLEGFTATNRSGQKIVGRATGGATYTEGVGIDISEDNVISTETRIIDITKAEYNALPEEEKMDESVYYNLTDVITTSADIDDDSIDTVSVWSSRKVADELALKGDGSFIGTRAEWDALGDKSQYDGKMVVITDDEVSDVCEDLQECAEKQSNPNAVAGATVGLELDEKISQVNSKITNDLKFKLIGSVVGAGNVLFDTTAYNELAIFCHYSNTINVSIHVPCPSQITALNGSTSETVRAGQYVSANNFTSCIVNVNKSFVAFIELNSNGTNVTSSSTMYVYAR